MIYFRSNIILFLLVFFSFKNAFSQENDYADDKNKKTGIIFSLDGGGVRGLLQLPILREIQERLGEPLVNKVDMWGGTSVGGILTLALTKPDETDPTKPAYNPSQLIKVLKENAPKIFDNSWYNTLTSVWGLLTPKYSSNNVEKMAAQYLKDSWISESLGNVIISGYDTKNGTPIFFKSATARKKPEYDFYMADVARLTSSAQTYFPIAQIQSKTGMMVEGIDGGNIANNITACALIEARKMLPNAQDWLVVSLGTGQCSKRIDYHSTKHKGGFFWARPTISITMNGVSQVVDYQMDELLPPHAMDNGFYKKRYYRFNPFLPAKNIELDDSSPENLEDLLSIGERYAKENSHEIDMIVDELKKIPSRQFRGGSPSAPIPSSQVLNLAPHEEDKMTVEGASLPLKPSHLQRRASLPLINSLAQERQIFPKPLKSFKPEKTNDDTRGF